MTTTHIARRGRVTVVAPSAGVALVAAGAALWGTDGALRAPLVSHWSPWTIVLYEHLILTAVVLPRLVRSRRALTAIRPRVWLSVLGVAWGASALATLAFTFAFRYGNPDVVILLQKSRPLWAVGAAAVLLGERPRRHLLPVALAALLGTYLLSFGALPPGMAFAGAQGKAALLALVAAGLWGTATVLGRSALRTVDPSLLTGLRFACALPLLAVVALSQHAVVPGTSAAADWTRVVLMALVPGLLGMLLYYRGLRTTPASVATFAELAFPATALVVNYVALGATVDGVQLAGFAIMWAAIVLLHRIPVRVSTPRLAAQRATGA